MAENQTSPENSAPPVEFKLGPFTVTRHVRSTKTLVFLFIFGGFLGLVYVADQSVANGGLMKYVIEKKSDMFSGKKEFMASFIKVTGWVSSIEETWSELQYPAGNESVKAKTIRNKTSDVVVQYTNLSSKPYFKKLGDINKIVYHYNLAQIQIIEADLFREESQLVSAEQNLKRIEEINATANFDESDYEFIETHLPEAKIARLKLIIQSLYFVIGSDIKAQEIAKDLMLREYPKGCEELEADKESRIEHYDVLWTVGCVARIPERHIKEHHKTAK